MRRGSARSNLYASDFLAPPHDVHLIRADRVGAAGVYNTGMCIPFHFMAALFSSSNSRGSRKSHDLKAIYG